MHAKEQKPLLKHSYNRNDKKSKLPKSKYTNHDMNSSITEIYNTLSTKNSYKISSCYEQNIVKLIIYIRVCVCVCVSLHVLSG